jgi:hypothetical protein
MDKTCANAKSAALKNNSRHAPFLVWHQKLFHSANNGPRTENISLPAATFHMDPSL